MQKVRLSQRLQTIADMVTEGNRVADIGCDHGFVSIYLVQQGISSSVIAMDVRKGPLGMAHEHISQAGLEKQIETRLSNGMDKLLPGEADSLILAGMGGRLMMDILSRGRIVTLGMREFILQPQSELPLFRQFLRKNGLTIVDEKVVYEEGKYYFPMKVVWDNRELSNPAETKGSSIRQDAEEVNDEDFFGPILLKRRSKPFLEYLEKELHTYQGIMDKLRASSGEKAFKRMMEIQEEMSRLKRVLEQ